MATKAATATNGKATAADVAQSTPATLEVPAPQGARHADTRERVAA